jgi:hypothetical protein
MTTLRMRSIGAALAAAAFVAACSTTPGPSSAVPETETPATVATDAPSAAGIPAGFPLGAWTTTITEDDLRAAGVTDAGELNENTGEFTLTMSEDGTWTTAQVTDAPVRWPVFEGTWTATGPGGFSQVTTFPTDFSGDVVDFTWKIDDGSLILKVVTPPDHILPIIMESHPWHPVG